ncbi:MAG: HAMP domain-containing sensor histidine kinase [Gemmatimonadales bacterium]
MTARSRQAWSWPLALLVASLVVMLGTAWKAHVLQRQRTQTADQLLHDYAAFGAWTFQRQLTIHLEEFAWQVFSPIAHRQPHNNPRMPSAANLAGYRAKSLLDCRCDSTTQPASYFSYILGSDTMMVVGTPLSAAAQETIRHRTGEFLGAGDEVWRARSAFLGPFPELPSLIAYQLMPTTFGDTVLYGLVVDRASLAPTFTRVLGGPDLLPAAVSRGRAGNELLAVEVLDRNGTLLYRDPRWPAEGLVAEERMPESEGGLLVRMTVLPSAAASLVAGGLPGNEVSILSAVVVLAVLLAVVGVAQLRREQQLARLRSGFVASVSHELRTPLAQIRLFLDTLRLKRYASDDQREWLVGHLARETTRLEHLIENVLHFSRLERGAPAPLSLARTDLAALVRETVDGFAPLAHSHRAGVECDLTPGLEAEVDPARMRQVLLNLLDNAVKFGPPGQVIRVGVREVAGRIRIEVCDQGHGIPAAERVAIWEPYFRGSRAEAAAVGGSGIGLAIVKEAVEAMAGEVRVEDAPGGGALFVVEFPALHARVSPTPHIPVAT